MFKEWRKLSLSFFTAVRLNHTVDAAATDNYLVHPIHLHEHSFHVTKIGFRDYSDIRKITSYALILSGLVNKVGI